MIVTVINWQRTHKNAERRKLMISRTICLICTIGILLFAVGSMKAVEAQEFVTDGLVAMYTLDKADVKGAVVKDTLGKNDAKLMGNLKSVAGQIGEAYEFEGKANNYIEIPKLGAFDTVSVECWALEGQFGGIQGIVSTWMWEAGKVHFKFEGNQIQVHKNDGVKIRLNAEANKWYHIIYTSDTKKSELKLYVDGELVDEGNAGATPENMDERRIGSEHDGRFLIGMIDEVRIYDRILDEKEVAQNFKVKSNKLAVEPGGKLPISWGVLKSLRN
jgi:hypothetical protein